MNENQNALTMTNSNDTGDGAVAAVATGTPQQQNAAMDYTTPRGDGSESDVATMDDVQFTASLDRLLDSELMHTTSATTTAAMGDASTTTSTNVVSTDPSVASSSASSSIAVSTTARSSSQPTTGIQQLSTSSSFSMPAAVSTSRGPTVAQSQQHMRPAAPPTNALFPPPPKKPAAAVAVGTGPSPLTARLAFGMTPGVMTTTSMPMTTTTMSRKRAGSKRRREAVASSSAVSEDEEERERRRHDRNLREQQRSRRITEQITHLRQVLQEAHVPCKPDKNSTLISVVDYIRQLQNRSSMLDEEHKKLLDTIARTNEMVNNQYYQATAADSGSTITGGGDLLSEGPSQSNLATTLEEEQAVFVQGLDYKSVFAHCGIALAVASIDGRFMDANAEFEQLSGYSRGELLPGETQQVRPDEAPSSSSPSSSDAPPRNLSLFNLLNREDMEQVFCAMSGMLKRPVVQDASDHTHQDYWSGTVRQNREQNSSLRMNITLVRTPGGRPKFFNCSLTAEQMES